MYDPQTRAALIAMATRKHGDKIVPVGQRKAIDQGFVQYGDELTFWYDTLDGSTHMVSSKKLEHANV